MLDEAATIKNVFDYEDYLQGPPVAGTEGNEAGSGSFMVIGTGITTVTFNVYVNGKMTAGGNPVPSLFGLRSLVIRIPSIPVTVSTRPGHCRTSIQPP